MNKIKLMLNKLLRDSKTKNISVLDALNSSGASIYSFLVNLGVSYNVLNSQFFQEVEAFFRECLSDEQCEIDFDPNCDSIDKSCVVFSSPVYDRNIILTADEIQVQSVKSKFEGNIEDEFVRRFTFSCSEDNNALRTFVEFHILRDFQKSKKSILLRKFPLDYLELYVTAQREGKEALHFEFISENEILECEFLSVLNSLYFEKIRNAYSKLYYLKNDNSLLKDDFYQKNLNNIRDR